MRELDGVCATSMGRMEALVVGDTLSCSALHNGTRDAACTTCATGDAASTSPQIATTRWPERLPLSSLRVPT